MKTPFLQSSISQAHHVGVWDNAVDEHRDREQRHGKGHDGPNLCGAHHAHNSTTSNSIVASKLRHN
jgi:hypothetical protein